MTPKFLRNLIAGRGCFENLQTAIRNKDALEVEKVLRYAFQNQETDEIVSLMGELCVADWHSMHEDAIVLIQKFGGTADVPALECVAGMKLSYLAYDGRFGLARRATWALADIGGNGARHALERIAVWDNPVIAGYAKRRLTRWDVECERKRNR
jgi:hypothetical protein